MCRSRMQNSVCVRIVRLYHSYANRLITVYKTHIRIILVNAYSFPMNIFICNESIFIAMNLL